MTEPAFLLFMKLFTGIGVGLVLGSFITMLSYRLPRRLSIVTPRSFCPSCQKQLQIRDLVPVYSYLASNGKCRSCGARIGLRYLLIEIATAFFITLAMLAFGFSFLCLLVVCLCIALLTWIVIKLEAW